MIDLTPVHTALQERTYRTQAEVDALLAAAFAAFETRPCAACGAMVDARGATLCLPCSAGNRREPLYGPLQQRLAELQAENTRLRGRLAACRCSSGLGGGRGNV